MAMQPQISAAFPTLIGRFQFPEADTINHELSANLRVLRSRDPGTQHANAGGWHSSGDLLAQPLPALATLKQWIVEALQAMVTATAELPEVKGRSSSFQGSFSITAWGNIIQQGHYHRQHNHPGSAWSGVYYVDAGDCEPGSIAGVLELFDPRPFTEMVETPGSPYGQRVLIRPQPGLMVLFPGWLYHFVHPYRGNGERISIAFNTHWHPDRGT